MGATRGFKILCFRPGPRICTALHAASSSQFSRFKYLSRQESLDVEALRGSTLVGLLVRVSLFLSLYVQMEREVLTLSVEGCKALAPQRVLAFRPVIYQFFQC